MDKRNLKLNNINPNKLAKAIHVKEQVLMPILKHKAPMTADISIRLGIFFGLPSGYFLNKQSTLAIKKTEKDHAEEYKNIKSYKHL